MAIRITRNLRTMKIPGSIMHRFLCVFLVGTMVSQVMMAQRQRELLQSGMSFDEITATMEQLYHDKQITDREYKQYKRWEIISGARLDENGELTNSSMRNYQAMQRYTQRQKQSGDQLYRITHGLWEDISPGDFSPGAPANGRINVIARHPTNPNTLFVGAPVGGLWVTYNGGSSWINLTDGMTDIGVSGIVIHPTNPNIMYILTGDGDQHYAPSMGVFKSYNGGYDWEPTGLQWDRDEHIFAYKLIMRNSVPDIMYAATNSGLFRTQDGWATFTKVLNEDIVDVDLVPTASGDVYAADRDFIWKGTVNGTLWDMLHNNIDIGLPGTSVDNWARAAVAVTEDDPSRVYALFARPTTVEYGTQYYELYVSYDAGQTFALQSSGNPSGLPSYQPWYNFTIEVEPGHPENVFIGTVDLYKSTNSGASFTFLGAAETHPDFHALLFDGSTLYVGTDGGLAKSTDGGASFTNLSHGLNIMQFYDIDVLGTDVMGGTQDNGTNGWSIGDAVGDYLWSGDGFEVIFDPTDDVIYLCSQEERHRFVGGDEDMITPPGQQGHWDASWIMHPTDFDTLYCAHKTLARSYDRGDDWTIILDTSVFENKGASIRAIAQGVDDPDVMYVSNRRQVFKTEDVHASSPVWTDVTGVLPVGPDIGGLAVYPTNHNIVYATLHGYSEGNKVFRSIGGTIWANMSGSLPNVPVHCIAFQPGANEGVYIGTDIGMFYRNLSMADWIWFSNGLPRTRIEDIKVTDTHVYAGTFGRGIWRSEHYTTCPVSLTLTGANDPSPPHTTGTQVFSASWSIVATDRIITGGIGTDVTYQAGNYVQLNPGFHAEVNNEFLVRIGGCP